MVTPVSVTVPQLVTVAATLIEVVGGNTVGTVEAPVDTGSWQLVLAIPAPPVFTAGGERAMAVMTIWCTGAMMADPDRADAVAPRDWGPSGALAVGGGTQTDEGNRTGMCSRRM